MDTSLTILASRVPPLVTERLILQKIEPRDAADMYFYAQSPNVTKFLLWEPHKNLRHTQRYIELLQEKYDSFEFYDWGVHLKESGRLIGTCGFASLDESKKIGEIGYVFSPDIWGQGYATESVNSVINYGFHELLLSKIIAKYMYGNDASAAVMHKCGMHSVGILPDELFVKGKYRTILQYELIKEDWLANRNQ